MLDDEQLEQKMAFKGWTINAVLRHLHVWNYAAALSLSDGKRFFNWFETTTGDIAARTLPRFEANFLNGLKGPELVAAWRERYRETANLFGTSDPKARVVWSGPGMSVRSSITARLMETWAHGQEIYDQLGILRENADRIGSIVVLGINTYRWTFENRGMPVPGP